MFTSEDRTALRGRLLAAASEDAGVCAAAIVGSASRGDEDAWSDIDLALRLRPGVDPNEVAERWTELLGRDQDVVDLLDLWADGALYRVFLTASTLQIDLSFWPYDRFRATGPAFRLLFGESNEPSSPAPADAAGELRRAWLYALHVRSAVARDRPWQAVWMLEGLRNYVVALACGRHGLVAHQGREVDKLPAEIREGLAGTLITSTDGHTLRAVFRLLVAMLNQEAAHLAPDHQSQLATTLHAIVASIEASPENPRAS